MIDKMLIYGADIRNYKPTKQSELPTLKDKIRTKDITAREIRQALIKGENKDTEIVYQNDPRWEAMKQSHWIKSPLVIRGTTVPKGQNAYAKINGEEIKISDPNKNIIYINDLAYPSNKYLNQQKKDSERYNITLAHEILHTITEPEGYIPPRTKTASEALEELKKAEYKYLDNPQESLTKTINLLSDEGTSKYPKTTKALLEIIERNTKQKIQRPTELKVKELIEPIQKYINELKTLQQNEQKSKKHNLRTNILRNELNNFWNDIRTSNVRATQDHRRGLTLPSTYEGEYHDPKTIAKHYPESSLYKNVLGTDRRVRTDPHDTVTVSKNEQKTMGKYKFLTGGYLGITNPSRIPEELFDPNLTNDENKEKIFQSILRTYGKEPEYTNFRARELVTQKPIQYGMTVANLPMGLVGSGVQGIIDAEEDNTQGSANKMFFGLVDAKDLGKWKYPAKFGEGVALAYAFDKIFRNMKPVIEYTGKKLITPIAEEVKKKVTEKTVKKVIGKTLEKTGDVLFSEYVGHLSKEGYVGVKDIKGGKGSDQLVLTGLEGLGFFTEDQVIEGLRKLSGVYNPKTMSVPFFPEEQRETTIAKITEGLAGKKGKTETVTGEPVRTPEIFQKPVDSKRGGTTANVPVSFATPKTGEISYVGKVFTDSPSRTPKYWQEWMDKLIENKNLREHIQMYGLPLRAKPTITEKETTFIPKKAGESVSKYYNRLQKIAEKEQKIISTVPPKSLAGSTQPELEVTEIIPESMKKGKAFIGYNKFGDKIYKHIDTTKQSKVEEMWKAWKDNYKWAIDTEHKLAEELSKDMKFKYNDIYVKGKDRYGTSGLEHMRNVENNFRKILKENKIKASDNEIKATARLHDILKKRTLNFKDEPMIEKAILEGYLDDIPLVKALSKAEKERVARTIGLHQDTNPNIISNLMLDDYSKAFINADRLDITRKGIEVNPEMLFALGKSKYEKKIIDESTQKLNRMTKEQKEQTIKKAKQESTQQKEYDRLYDEYNKYEKPYNYGEYPYLQEGYSKDYYDNYMYEPKYQYKAEPYYKISPYKSTYYKPTGYKATYAGNYPIKYAPKSTYTTGYTAGRTTTYAPPTTTKTPKESKEKAPIPELKREKQVNAYVPYLYDKSGHNLKGEMYATYEDAERAGMKITDETAYDTFKILKDTAEPSEIRKAPPYKTKHKFKKLKGNVYKEKRYNKFDKPKERQGGFNIMPYVFQTAHT